MIEIYELTGNLPGTPTKVNNINFKNSSAISSKYWQYPLRRMESNAKLDPHNIRYSYTKYVYLKFSSEYTMKNFKFDISIEEPSSEIPFETSEESSSDASNSFLYYKMTNTYAVPTSNFDGSLTQIKDRLITLFPRFSTSGYSDATTYLPLLNQNTVYYSNLFVFQTAVQYSNVGDVGNGPSCKFEFSFDNW